MSTLHEVTRPLPGCRVRWSGLHGSAAALLLARCVQQASGPLLLVAADLGAALRYAAELEFYMDSGQVLSFPDRQTLPYDTLAPDAVVVSERMGTLQALPALRHGIVITSMAALAHRLPPPSTIAALRLAPGVCLTRGPAWLTESGYRAVPKVSEPGEFAVRGALIDVYPMGHAQPCRIDLCDTSIESIRQFDPGTQRTTTAVVEELLLLPAQEVSMATAQVERFRRGFRKAFAGNPMENPVYRQLAEGIMPPGVEYYLPLFYEHTVSLLDYLPAGACVVLGSEVREELVRLHDAFARRQQESQLSAEHLLYTAAELDAALQSWPCIELGSGQGRAEHFDSKPPPMVRIDARHEHPLARLEEFMADYSGRVLLVAEGAGQADVLGRMLEHLQPQEVSGWAEFAAGTMHPGLTVAPLERGLYLQDQCVITGLQARQVARPARYKHRSAEDVLRDFDTLVPGIPVVHKDHGVGRYRGLFTMRPDGVDTDFLCLEYAGADRLYVPVTALDRVSRYTGAEPEHAPLHRLGDAQWRRQRARAQRSLHDLAVEILDVQARREARPGYACVLDADRYATFCKGFACIETPCQERVIGQILDDLLVDRPMDRLVCGDAGFGKTELALRAAFVVSDNARQVAVLAPTVLLAEQHYRVFSDRFADWPIRVALLSRGGAGQEAVVQGLADGTVDIVIGTHKLLYGRIRYRSLGLLIIDEEQRFGVRQKERLKKLRTEVDVLALSATPIPRTLDTALTGLRELSTITTPPPGRRPVLTQVHAWDTTSMIEAMQRELQRGGQVFFVHDRIESLQSCTDTVCGLMPAARIRHAHGRMPPAVLEQLMADFRQRRFDILVCTTIIENGLDIPNANTILIDCAHRFGLAQLYQLRGRVGRSHRQGYAQLLTPPHLALGEPARCRLQVLVALDTLGVGCSLALHDLELRGAGELLGKKQSGHIHQLGYGTYLDMLRETVAALRSGTQAQDTLEPELELNLGLPALLPADYVSDICLRLSLYKRIAALRTMAELDEMRAELIDRFGPLPPPADYLLRISVLRCTAAPLAVTQVRLHAGGGAIQFRDPANVDVTQLLRLVQDDPHIFSPTPQHGLRIKAELPEPEQRIQFLQTLLTRLQTRDAA